MKNKEWLIAFGAHLRKLRDQHNMSLQDLANESDISKITIYRIENARLNPTLSTVVSLAKGLNIGLKELIDIEI